MLADGPEKRGRESFLAGRCIDEDSSEIISALKQNAVVKSSRPTSA